MLTDEQIVKLWSELDPEWGDDWRKGYLEFVSWVRAATDAELRTPGSQKKLWNARVITPAGRGDSIKVDPLLTDSAFVDAIVGLRTHVWSQDVDERAAEVQGEYDRLMGMAVARGVKSKPWAKLQRLLGAILPGELTCVLNHDAAVHAEGLLLGNAGPPSIVGQVKMRARLRTVLGDEKDLAEHVRRSTFCWWLHEHHDKLSAGEMPPWEETEEPDETDESEEAPLPLVLWPFARQYKGNNTAPDLVRSYRAIVEAAVGGSSRPDLVSVLQNSGDFEGLNATSVGSHVVRVRGIGLIEERDGVLFPTAEGNELLAHEQPDVLVRLFFERVFGFAQLVRHLDLHPASLDEQIAAALRAIYPSWTKDWAVLSLRAWCSDLGLIESAEGKWSLTEYGAEWANRLPEALPMPPVEVVEPDRTSVPPPSGPARLPYPEISAILAKFKANPDIAGFVFDDRLLASLHTAWRSNPKKRFVLLSGLSGTGKTAITLCYTQAVCELMGIPVEAHREIVPVSPDWRDPSGLLGYFNALHADPTFQAEPALRLVLRAAADPGKPYFLFLDEMNLARVERYFAPFLSAMETGKDLVLHANTVDVNDVPPRVPWPTNLHIAGTVNMDETTHPFSDKVLDRAFTLELWDVDLPRYFARPGAQRNPDVEATLIELHDAMRPVRRHFGYRTAGEVLAFMAAVPVLAGTPPSTFLDQAVFSKVLPRLRGEQTTAFQAALASIAAICKRRDLRACSDKIAIMQEVLLHTGVTRFWA
jgi:5-methylcytosine-specific restriction enzyme B